MSCKGNLEVVRRSRVVTANAQAGYCGYCEWDADPGGFCEKEKLAESVRRALLFQELFERVVQWRCIKQQRFNEGLPSILGVTLGNNEIGKRAKRLSGTQQQRSEGGRASEEK